MKNPQTSRSRGSQDGALWMFLDYNFIQPQLAWPQCSVMMGIAVQLHHIGDLGSRSRWTPIDPDLWLRWLEQMGVGAQWYQEHLCFSTLAVRQRVVWKGAF